MADTTFPDIGDYDAQRQQLARRRKLAEELLRTRNPTEARFAPNGGALFGGGPGQTLANGVDVISGILQQPGLDAEEKQLASNEAQQANAILSSIPASGPERQAALLSAGNRMPSLRNSISALLAADERKQIADDNRLEKSEQEAANRVEKANSEERYRRTFEQSMALKQAPTSHITIQTGGAGGAANPFAGTSTQVGVDRNGNPVYRVSKTGSVYSFDETGQPVAHEGIIMPKPAPAKEPTESERGAAGYLGRMQAAEQNLGTAKPFSLPVQIGLDRAPNMTNFVLTPEQQVQRQQQEDWVRAKLRKESGAVIGDQEMAREIRTYFPMAGDSDKVIRQKAQSRAQALEQMRSSAGRSKPTEAAPVPEQRVTVRSPAEWQALEPGTPYVTADGKKGVR